MTDKPYPWRSGKHCVNVMSFRTFVVQCVMHVIGWWVTRNQPDPEPTWQGKGFK